MAKRLTNSEKNARARVKYQDALARRRDRVQGMFDDEQDRQDNAWKTPSSTRSDVVSWSGGQETERFKPRASGGGLIVRPDGTQEEVDGTDSKIKDLLKSTGADGESTKPKEGGALLREKGREQLREGGLGGLADFGEKVDELGLSSGADWLLEDVGKTEAPQNVGQWLVNLLSTGTYVGANATHEGVKAAQKGDADVKRAAEKGDVLGTVGAEIGRDVGVAGAALGGAGRGIAEGLGFRFDGERPQTWGQNLEELGSEDLLKGALGDQAGGVAQGTLGTVADIGLDPTTYLTLGASGFARGAMKGAQESAKGAQTVAGKIGKGAVGAVKGANEEMATVRAGIRADRADSRAANATRREYARDVKTMTPADLEAKWGDAPKFQPQLELEAGQAADEFDVESLLPEGVNGSPERTFVGAANGDVFEPQNLDLRNPQLALPAKPSDYRPRAGSVEEVQDAARMLNPVTRATDELLPSLQRTVTPNVDPRMILDDALATGTRTTTAPLLSPEGAQDVGAVITRLGQLNREGTAAQKAKGVRGAMDTLRANPEVGPRLSLETSEGVTVGDIIEGALRGHRASQKQLQELPNTLVEQTAPAITTPALRDAIDQLQPGLREALGVSGSKLHSLVNRLGRASANPAQQNEILSRVLGKSYQAGYATFRDALGGVARGELGPDEMERMIAALGIKTRATKPETLRHILGTRGAATYEDAVAQIPTREQVNEMFNITDEVIEQARGIDADTAMDAYDTQAREAASMFGINLDEASEGIPTTNPDMPAPKPPKPPVMSARRPADFDAREFDANGGQGLNPVGQAAYDGIRAFGDMLREKTLGGTKGNTLTSYTDVVSTRVHRAVVNSKLKMKYLKKGGEDRAERFYPRYLEAMQLVESWARSKGMWPHLVDSKYGTGNIWVSSTEALVALPDDVVQAVLFAPMKNRKSFAKEAGIGFTNGFTVYPNHIMTGLKAALAGASPEQVTQAIVERAIGASKGMQRDTDRYVKAFAETAEGRAAISRLADEMTQPDYLERIKARSNEVKPVAEAVSQRYIDGIVEQVGARLIRVLQENPDRGTLMAELDEVGKWASESAAPALLESDRVSASVTERLNSAIVQGILGEKGYLTAKHDWQFSTAFEEVAPATLAQRQSDVVAREMERLGQRGVSRPTSGGVSTRPNPVQERATIARVADEEVQDTYQSVKTDVEEEMGVRYEDAPEELYSEMDARIAYNLLEQIGSRTSGRFGMRNTFGIRTSAEEGTLAQAARFTQNVHDWVRTVSQRMSAERGVRVTPQQALDHINGPIFRALAATDPENWGTRGALYSDLTAGNRLPDTTGAARPVSDALSHEDALLALELQRFVDHVFNPNPAGLLGRSGLAASDLADASKWYLRGDYETYKMDPGQALVDQAQKWRAWVDSPSPLDIINKTHQAVQSALVPQQIGHAMSSMFSHTSFATGKTTKQLYAEGWRKIDTADASGVGRFVDPNAYFPPEILSEIRHLDTFLAASRGFNPDGFMGKVVIRPYDAATHFLKSANTIWRPGHHVTNVLGEFGMLLMAGVNPLNAVRAVKTIRAGGGALDGDLSKLDEIARPKQAAKQADPKFAGETVKIVLRGGKQGRRVVEMPLSEVWQKAVNSGVALTHTAARDMVGDVATGIRPANRMNPLGQVDETLGKFSAHRDNMTRIAHFIDKLESGVYANIDDAVGKAQTAVHDYHPTIRTLSRFEQKYARRLVFFYTWVRQAVARVLKTALDQPGYVTMPFKAQYNAAEASGLEPESIGGPTTNDPRLASYTENSLLGPTAAGDSFMGGMFAGGNPDAEQEDLWSWSMSSPQIDTLQTLFGTFNAPKQTGNPADDLVNSTLVPAQQLGQGVLNPVLTFPYDVATEATKFGGSGKGATEIAAESGGLLTGLARSIPGGTDPETGATRSVYAELFPESSIADKEPWQQEQDMQRYLFNLVTGFKVQNATTPSAVKDAKRRLRDDVKAKLTEQGITDADTISEVRDYIWDLQMQTQSHG